MEIGVWLGILLSAVLAFLVGDFYGQPLHWYLFILIIVVGDAFLLLRKLWGFLPVDNLAYNRRLDESVRTRAKEVAFQRSFC